MKRSLGLDFELAEITGQVKILNISKCVTGHLKG